MFIKEFGYIYALQKGLAQLSNRRKTLAKKNGDVAQLARVLDWQSRGRGFESHLLHKRKPEAELLQVFLVLYDVDLLCVIHFELVLAARKLTDAQDEPQTRINFHFNLFTLSVARCFLCSNGARQIA